jgi:hypothetical protein
MLVCVCVCACVCLCACALVCVCVCVCVCVHVCVCVSCVCMLGFERRRVLLIKVLLAVVSLRRNVSMAFVLYVVDESH